MNESSHRRITWLATPAIVIWCYAFVRNTPNPCVVWDDGFMFVRYADRLLHGHGISWNSHGAPVWGATSLAFLAVVTPMHALISDPVWAALASSFFAGALFVAAQIGLTCVVVRTPVARLFAVALLLAVLTRGGNALAMHFRSGMDTTFAMAYLALYLLVTHQLATRARNAAVICTGVLGGLAIVARPDLAVFTLTVPVVLATSCEPLVRQASLRALALTALVMGFTWAACCLYFRAPAPLAFYVKSIGIYDADFVRLYQRAPAAHLSVYLDTIWPMLAVIVGGAAFQARETLRARIDIAVALAIIAFVAYYRFGVLQVMHYSQRFYYPTLPALIYLAAMAYARLVEQAPRAARTVLDRVGWRSRLGLRLTNGRVMIGLAAVALALGALAEFIPNDTHAKRTAFCPVPDREKQRQMRRWIWPGINRVGELPDDLVIATTEVGLPGALYPNKCIVDLSGLNDSAIARKRRSPYQAVRAANADIVYLHSDYVSMNRSFTEDRSFNSDYVVYRPQDTRFLSVFLRRKSKYFRRLFELVAED